MDIEAAMDHATKVSREVVWLGRSTPRIMTQYLTAYRGYLNQGVEGTFIQLLVARSVIDATIRVALANKFSAEHLRLKPPDPTQEDVGSTTAVLRKLDLRTLAEPTVNTSGDTSAAVAWLECPPWPPAAVIPGATISLGRRQTSDVVLPHQGVSSVHAEITCDASGAPMTLEDGSTYGTFVNGEKVHRASKEIELGDVIAIGPFILIVARRATRSRSESPASPRSRCTGS
jgi:hypothetical protein